MTPPKIFVLVLCALATGWVMVLTITSPPNPFYPELVTVEPGPHLYRASGQYLKNGQPVDAPLVAVRISDSLKIMKYQVSAKQYQACVFDGACDPPFKNRNAQASLPATGVSFNDAQKYAVWLASKTGYAWRLPSDEEWSYAAGSRFVDDALNAEEDSGNPATRWLLQYRKFTGLAEETDRTIRPLGAHGANENGLYDMSGNVWEWTTGCYSRAKVADDGQILPSKSENCGVRIAEGQHRAYITFFIKDAKAGGCAVGAPPAYLGFRLVKDETASSAFDRIRNWWDSARRG